MVYMRMPLSLVKEVDTYALKPKRSKTGPIVEAVSSYLRPEVSAENFRKLRRALGPEDAPEWASCTGQTAPPTYYKRQVRGVISLDDQEKRHNYAALSTVIGFRGPAGLDIEVRDLSLPRKVRLHNRPGVQALRHRPQSFP